MERTVIEIDLWLRQPTKTNTILLESHLLSLVRPDRDVGANQSDLLIRKEVDLQIGWRQTRIRL